VPQLSADGFRSKTITGTASFELPVPQLDARQAEPIPVGDDIVREHLKMVRRNRSKNPRVNSPPRSTPQARVRNMTDPMSKKQKGVTKTPSMVQKAITQEKKSHEGNRKTAPKIIQDKVWRGKKK